MPVATTHRLVRVTRNRPCPQCRHTDWCLIAPDGLTGICCRSGQGRPVDLSGAGTGWAWGERDKPAAPMPPLRKMLKEPHDWDYVLNTHMRNGGDNLGDWPYKLSVSGRSLTRLGALQDRMRRLLVPMWDERGHIIGVHVRSREGRKFALTGSHNGLYLPDCTLPDCLETLWVCEGASDCAALLDLGVYAVGRSSCTGNVEAIRTLCYGLHLVIMADRDEAKLRPDGSLWYPGQYGAEQLAAACYRRASSVKIVFPGQGKDCRSWLMAGCTPAVLRCVEKSTAPWKPGRAESN